MFGTVFEIAGWVLASCVVVAAAEYVVHRWPMHSARVVHALPVFRGMFTGHARLHHGRYYRAAFDHDPDPAAGLVSMRFSIPEHLAAAAVVIGPLVLAGRLAGAGCFAAVVVAHCVVWNAVHVEMHVPGGRWVRRTGYFRYLEAFHRAHHLHPGRNFAAVFPPVMDLVFKTYHPPVPLHLEL